MRTRLALLLALLLLVTACGDGQEAASEDTPTPATTASDPEPTATGTEDEGGEDQDVTAFFARVGDSGNWVEPETHRVEDSTEAVARAAIELMVSGSPRNPDLSNAVPEGTEVLDVTLEDRILVVDLSSEVTGSGHGSAEELAFSQQLAHTGAQFETVDAVRLHVDGEPVDELWGHLDWSQPVEPDLFALAPITFEFPRWGDTVEPGPVVAGGQANTFEATLELRLIDPTGAVIEETFTTATSGSGERGQWEHTFDTEVTEAGTWTVEAEEPDPSGGEGRPPFVTRVQFQIA